MNARLRLLPLLLLFFLAAWLPRVLVLDRFVTPDEPKWLTRSANFYQALSEQQFAATYQREHPGVTVMWAGTLGLASHFPTYPTLTSGPYDSDTVALETWLQNEGHTSALALLVAGRWWVVLCIALALVGCFAILRGLLGAPVAALAVLWCAWDPFHVALSRQLHTDGLVSSFVFVALLALVRWLHGGRTQGWLIVSAIAMALGWLTKMSAVILLPFGGLLVAACWLYEGRRRTTGDLFRFLRPIVLWGAMAVATFVLLWPAMWVAPLDTLRQMATVMGYYAETGHGDGNFFLGQIIRDPGPLFYPVQYLFRTTPLTLLGLVGAATAWWQPRPTPESTRARRVVASLAAFVLFFTLTIALSAKQSDRYLLPAFLPLDVIAAWGWVEGARRLTAASLPKLLAPIVASALILHALLGFQHAPYYLTYYNPLLGGTPKAASLLTVGWGEGLEAAGAWLSHQPGAEKLRVLGWYSNGSLSYYLRGKTEPISERWDPYAWCSTDYVVTYVNQWQRHLPNEASHQYFSALPPAHRVYGAGIELARVYDMRGVPLPIFPEADERRADFGGKIRLATYQIERHEATPGDIVPITLNLQSLAPMETDYNVLVRLVGQDGQEVWRDEGWPWGAPTTDWPLCDVRPDGHQIAIPAATPPGLYAVTVTFYDPATFDALPITEANRPIPTGQPERAVALVHVGPPPTAARALEPTPHFGEVAALPAATLPESGTAGEALPVGLLWQSLTPTPHDYTIFVHLIAPDGSLAAQQDAPPLHGFAPTSLWAAGQVLLDEHQLSLPPTLVPGSYTLRVGLYSADGGRLPVSRAGSAAGDAVDIGTITVR